MDACLSCFLYGFLYRKSLKMWYNEVLEKQVPLALKGKENDKIILHHNPYLLPIW